MLGRDRIGVFWKMSRGLVNRQISLLDPSNAGLADGELVIAFLSINACH